MNMERKKIRYNYSKHVRKGTYMDCWEALYMQVFRQKKVLIDEQQVNDTNPLFDLAKISYTPCD